MKRTNAGGVLPFALLLVICLAPGVLGQSPAYPGDSVTYQNSGPQQVDQTLPDGFTMSRRDSGQDKVWLVFNSGSVAWSNRFLARTDPPDVGFRSARWTPTPDTSAGGECRMTVKVKPAKQPGHYRNRFKMVQLYLNGRMVTKDQFKKLKAADLARITEVQMFPSLKSGVWIDGNVN